ncbi:MAG: SAM-dependent methyltransferase [Oscillospiraceae bacterium]
MNKNSQMCFPDKKVLDVACGSKMFYFDKNDQRVLFCDNRTVDTTLCDGRKFVVAPDVECDFTNLPFQDGGYRMVVFDPPHLLYNTGKSKMADVYGSLNQRAEPTGYQHIKYGSLCNGWQDMLRKGFSECFRVLAPGGFLIFKWNETDIPVKKILELTDEKPLFGNRSGKASKTHWICFIRS